MWILEHYDEYININILDITQTDLDHIEISYAYETSPWYDSGPWDGYFYEGDCSGKTRTESNLVRTCTLDIYTADKIAGERYNHIDEYAFVLPIAVGDWTSIYGEKGFYLSFDVNLGFCIHEFQYLYKNPSFSNNSWEWRNNAEQTTVYFEKYIDQEQLQEMIDKLYEMN